MSARKRPLAEIAQAHSTPARYATATTTPRSHHRNQHQQHTPHYRLASKNAAANRFTRSVQRHTANTTQRRKISLNTVRPDGSARNILRQFAKLTAPITRKRVATPVSSHHIDDDKENRLFRDEEGEEDDSITFKKMKFAIDVQEDDSEILVPPTPSVLPDEDDEDEDVEQPTITFQRIQGLRGAIEGPGDRRKSGRLSKTGDRHDTDAIQDDEVDDDEQQEGEITIMTERGRRALSEDATGRFSRYSLGFEGFNMSAFGSEPEIRRESDKMTMDLAKAGFFSGDNEPSMILYGGDDESVELQDVTHELHSERSSPAASPRDGETLQIPAIDDVTFRLPIPDTEVDDQEMEVQHQQIYAGRVKAGRLAKTESDQIQTSNADTVPAASKSPASVRHPQSLLEAATATARKSRAKRQKLTREGVLVPTFPSGLIKKTVMDSHARLNKRPPKLGRDHMQALEQATEWFFEQVGEDLAAYSNHGKRKKRVLEDDVLLLMQRQKLLKGSGELMNLARVWLPKEILQDLDLPDEL